MELADAGVVYKDVDAHLRQPKKRWFDGYLGDRPGNAPVIVADSMEAGGVQVLPTAAYQHALSQAASSGERINPSTLPSCTS
jgi:hypothetical protein